MAILVPESQRRQPRNHEEIGDPGEGFDQVLDEPFGDDVVRRITSKVAKRQHSDRRFASLFARNVMERSSDRIALPFDLPARGGRSGKTSRCRLAPIDTHSALVGGRL